MAQPEGRHIIHILFSAALVSWQDRAAEQLVGAKEEAGQTATGGLFSQA